MNRIERRVDYLQCLYDMNFLALRMENVSLRITEEECCLAVQDMNDRVWKEYVA